MSTAMQLITYEEFLAMDGPDCEDLEFIKGEVIRVPAPDLEHQEIVRRIMLFLCAHVDSSRIWPDRTAYLMDDAEIQPDLSYSWPDQKRNNRIFVGAPMVAIEVLSPRDETETKISIYLGHGALEVWIVDRKLRHLVVCKPGTRVEYNSEYYSEALGLTITLADIFGK